MGAGGGEGGKESEGGRGRGPVRGESEGANARIHGIPTKFDVKTKKNVGETKPTQIFVGVLHVRIPFLVFLTQTARLLRGAHLPPHPLNADSCVYMGTSRL